MIASLIRPPELASEGLAGAGAANRFFAVLSAGHQNFRNRSGQLIDAAFEPARDLAIRFHECRHLLNRIKQSFLQFQLTLKTHLAVKSRSPRLSRRYFAICAFRFSICDCS